MRNFARANRRELGQLRVRCHASGRVREHSRFVKGPERDDLVTR